MDNKNKSDSQGDSTSGEITVPEEIRKPLTRPEPSPAVSSDEFRSSSMVAPNTDQLAKFAEETHQYIREYIRNADQKAAFFFATTTAILVFLQRAGVEKRWLCSPQIWTFLDFLGFLAMVALAGSAFTFLLVVFPRLKGSKKGIVFFQAIAEYESAVEYMDDVIRQTNHNLSTIKLKHCYELSKVCNCKYNTLLVGFWIGAIGMLATLLYLFLV